MVDAAIPDDQASAALADEPLSNQADISDEEAASQARALYRTGIPVIASDPTLAPLLDIGEVLFEYTETVALGTIDGATAGVAKTQGRLYVTDRRILHLGPRTTSIRLTDMAELTVTNTSVLIRLADGGGVVLDLRRPHRLRVLLAAAKAAARGPSAQTNTPA